MPDGRHEEFAYHSGGKLAAITEVGTDGVTSRTWSYTWTGDNLTRIDRPDGTAWSFLYEDTRFPSYLTRMLLIGTDASERLEMAWRYDLGGNVIAIWRGDAVPATYGVAPGPNAIDLWSFNFTAFDLDGLPSETEVTDPLGTIATYSFERDNASDKPKLTQLTGDCPACSLGPNSQRLYEDSNHPLRATREIDARGTSILFSYDIHGQLTGRVEAFATALERETTWTYHPDYPALPASIVQPSVHGGLAERRTDFTYDASGRLLERTDEGFEDGTAFSFTTEYTPNAAGQVLTADPPGYGTADQTTFTYDPSRGDLVLASRTDPLIGTTTYGHDPLNRRTEVTDVNGILVETSYDALNRVTQTLQHGAIPAEDLVTTYEYTPHGDLLRTTLPRGNVIEYGYDASGRLLSVERKPDAATPADRTLYALDAYGHRTREDRQRWTGSSWETRSFTEYEYSTRCHLDRALHADGSATEYAYDCEGNLESTWDANHPSAGQTAVPTSLFSYDELDRLTGVSQPWSGAGGGFADTSYGYDVQDHMTSVTDAEGNTTRYAYSDRDLMTEETSPVSGTTTHQYNEHGKMTQRTDARGVSMLQALDELDRVTSVDYPGDTLDIAYTYDDPGVPFSLGRLTRIARNGESLDYQYDHFGRLTQDGQLSYAHDANGNRTEISYPGGMKVVYTHDHEDREETATLQLSGHPDQALITAASYEPSGPLTSLTLGNGLTEARGYTSRYFPSTIDLAGPGSSRLSWAYTTDHEGNILSITDNLTPANSRTFAYQDVPYFLSTGNGPWGDLSWTYDRIGNRLTETRDGVTDAYSYVPNASLGNTAILQQVQLGIGGFKTYTYGPAGHLEELNAGGNVIDFTSDAAGRLSRVERPAGDARADFHYDGRSFLASSVGSKIQGLLADDFERGDFGCWDAIAGGPPGATGGDCTTLSTDPVYSSEGLLHSLAKVDGPAGFVGSKQVVYFAGRPVAWVTQETGMWRVDMVTTDHLGTPVALTDASGSVVWSGGFEPFGADWSGAGDAGLELRLPGQWSDQGWQRATMGDDQYYNVYRWYMYRIASYNRLDPLGLLEGDSHSFSFADSNPILNRDLLGLACSSVAAAYICCDGNDGFAVCAPRLPRNKAIAECIIKHEQDHVEWYTENAPCVCKGKESGACEFSLTRTQWNESECRGYKVEWRCLEEARAQAVGPNFQAIIQRQRRLERLGKSNFGCPVKEWRTEP